MSHYPPPQNPERKIRRGRRHPRALMPTPTGFEPLGVEAILAMLEGVQESVPGQWSARCPAHADTNPSLSVSEFPDGSVGAYCHRGCSFESIVANLGLCALNFGPTREPESTPTARRTSQPTTPMSPAVPQLVAAPGSVDDWGAIATGAVEDLSPEELGQLAAELHLPPAALVALHVGVVEFDGRSVYTFPEVDASGYVCGIATRSVDGSKCFLPGGHRGLIYAAGWADGDGPIFLVEGPTDVAALISAGLSGVGRPSAGGGGKLLADLLRPLHVEREIVIVAEFDPKRDGSWPGREGAEKVAKEVADGLSRKVKIVYPPAPYKDVRAWLAEGGAT